MQVIVEFYLLTLESALWCNGISFGVSITNPALHTNSQMLLSYLDSLINRRVEWLCHYSLTFALVIYED